MCVCDVRQLSNLDKPPPLVIYAPKIPAECKSLPPNIRPLGYVNFEHNLYPARHAICRNTGFLFL